MQAEQQIEQQPQAADSNEVQTMSDLEDEMAEVMIDELEAELEEKPKTTLLKPIRAKLSTVQSEQETTTTALLTPVRPQLQPVKKMRGSPPKSGRGAPPAIKSKAPLATLTPIKKMTPLKKEIKKMQPAEDKNN